MKSTLKLSVVAISVLALFALNLFTKEPAQNPAQMGASQVVIPAPLYEKQIVVSDVQKFEQGRRTFRFDTFGDEAFWGDTLKLHQAIAGSQFGGVGAGLSPVNALALGLKVDSQALPDSVTQSLRAGQINLNDPSVTLDLLKLNAIVGVTGFFDGST